MATQKSNVIYGRVISVIWCIVCATSATWCYHIEPEYNLEWITSFS